MNNSANNAVIMLWENKTSLSMLLVCKIMCKTSSCVYCLFVFLNIVLFCVDIHRVTINSDHLK